MKSFRTSLAKFNRAKLSGFSSSADLRPGDVAALVLGKQISGAHLFAYLFRRFGYPNIGWDDHKQLVTYALATPMPGLFLSVTPYLGKSNNTALMFGVLMTERVRIEMDRPRMELCQRHREFLDRWMRRHLTYGKLEPNEKREVLWEHKDKNEKPTGWVLVWKKKGDHKTKWGKWLFGRKFGRTWHMAMDWVIGEVYRKQCPEPKRKQKKRMAIWHRQMANWKLGPRNFIYRMNQAIDAAARDLLTSTNVRDIYVNAVRTGGDLVIIKGEEVVNTVKPYEHAGCTARYLASKRLLP